MSKSAKPEPGTPGFSDRWVPYMTYVVTTQQLQQWFDSNGPHALYDGSLWVPCAKRVAPNRHSVKFTKWEP